MNTTIAGSLLFRRFAIILVPVMIAGFHVGEAASQDAPEAVTIDLNEVQNSGISGTATLAPDGDLTDVSMRLQGDVEGNHPTHIHTGTCFNFDPNPLYPLETVILAEVDNTGWSESTVDVSLADLESSDYVILVHFSPERLDDYLVCGEIPRSAMVTGGEGTAAEAPSDTSAAADHSQHGGEVESVSASPTNDQLAAANATFDEAANVSASDPESDGATDDVVMSALPSAGAGPQDDRTLHGPLSIGLAGLAVFAMIAAIPFVRRGWR